MSNSDNTDSAQKAWNILRAGAGETSGIEIATVPTGVSTADGPVRLALGDSGEARMLLPLSGNESGKEIVGAPALNIKVSTYSYMGKQQRFLDLTCMSNELEKVFAELGDEILSRVRASSTCVKAAHSTIEEFRALLVQARTGQAPLHEVAGVVGELLVLNRLLDRNPEAWKSWRGPAGDRHDFASGADALEVKVSLGKGRTKITINGFDQLEEPAGGTLHLQHFELETVASGILSVGALGQAALSKASDASTVAELLAAVGCNDVSDPEWNQVSFRLEAESLYRVAKGFPRLVPRMLTEGTTPAGISGVSYTTDLSIAEAFRIPPKEIQNIEDKFC